MIMSIFFRLTFIFLLSVLGFPSHASDNIIYDVRIGAQGDQTRLVIEGILDQKPDVTLGLNTLIQTKPFIYKGGPVTTKQVHKIKRLTIDGNTGRIALDFTGHAILKQTLLLPSNEHATATRYVYDFSISGVQASQSSVTVKQAVEPEKPIVKQRQPLTIVIDAGHGGKDPGAIAGDGTREKNVTLAMVLHLKKELIHRGYKVALTREKDAFIPLRGRVQIGRKNKADLFISIHADSLPQKSSNTRGASVYTLSNTSSDKETAALAARENRADIIGGIDLSGEEADVANILIDLAMRDTMNQSKKLANSVVLAFNKNNMKMLNPPHRFAGFAVLKAADVPSVLIEIGFLSNEEEARALMTRSYQDRLANTISDAVDDYALRHHPKY